MDDQPVFTDPWWDLRGGGTTEHQLREELLAELRREVSAGHPLHGQPVVVAARSAASDDIVVELAAGQWARVHLTWKRSTETPPWPSTTFYTSVNDLERELYE